MKILIVYYSITGFTKKYVGWLQDELLCDSIPFEDFDVKKASSYDVIIFGSRLHIGKVDKLDKMKKMVSKTNIKFIVFATGGTPKEDKDAIVKVWNASMTKEEQQQIPHFYLPGGLSYNKMRGMDRFLMKTFAWFSQRKKDKSSIEEGRAKALQSSYDATSKNYIIPLIEYLKNINHS